MDFCNASLCVNGFCENSTCQCNNSRIGGRFCEQVQLGEPMCHVCTHMQCMQAKPCPRIKQTSLSYTYDLTFIPSLHTCVDYYTRPVNLSVGLSGESDRDITLTWDAPPGYEDIVGLWYRVRLRSFSPYSYLNITTLYKTFLWANLAPSTSYCASVKVESVHSQYTYYSSDVCFSTGGSRGECAHSRWSSTCHTRLTAVWISVQHAVTIAD